ncbi:MAG: hypothetical protein M3O35_10580 [Acidobacteriota bacterium]|nr:hypothetical protein [Acidobacteriota bacterium]
MTLEGIKEAIEQLPPEQQTVLASWLSERDWKAWDKQIERDFVVGGKGMPLLAELEQEIAEGKTRPIEEGFAERRNRASEFSV